MVALAHAHQLLLADVAHARYRPKRNAFHYRVYYLYLALDELSRARTRLLSINRPNLFSMYEKDHGTGGATNCEAWIRDVLHQWNITKADGRIRLLTMPRLFCYAFNPVSFWFCFDQNDQLRCVLSEVNNTFGDRHCYLSFHDDQSPITGEDWLTSRKIFHVSPFIPIVGDYHFRFMIDNQRVGVWINHHDDDGLLLTTSLIGKPQKLSDRALLYYCLRYPLVTLKVITLIHYQAVRLMIKGIRYIRRPQPPAEEISR